MWDSCDSKSKATLVLRSRVRVRACMPPCVAPQDLASSIDALTKVAAQLRAAGSPAQVASAEQHLALAEQARRASAAVLAPQRLPNELPGARHGCCRPLPFPALDAAEQLVCGERVVSPAL